MPPPHNMLEAHSNSSAVGEALQIRAVDAVVGCFLSAFVAITVFGNSLVIVAVVKEHYLRTITNYFIVSLATADLLMGLVVMPFSVVSYVTRDHWLFGPVWCDLWHAFDVLSTTASILNLCMIAVERFWAIENPISYPSRVTKRRCLMLVSAVWVCSCCISFPAILWWRVTSPPAEMHVCAFTNDPVYLICSSLVSFYAPLLVMVFVYCKIYRTATQLVRSWQAGEKVLHGSDGDHATTVVLRIHRGRQEVTTPDSPDGPGGLGRRFRSLGVRKKLARFSREQRAAKTLGVVMGIFIACWLPFFTCNIVLALKRNALGDHEPKVMMIVTWLGYINSSINPGIYAHSMRDFRRAFIKLLGCCRLCRSPSASSNNNLSAFNGAGRRVSMAPHLHSHPHPHPHSRPHLHLQLHPRQQSRLRRWLRRLAVTAAARIRAPAARRSTVTDVVSVVRSPLRPRCSRSASRLSSYQQLAPTVSAPPAAAGCRRQPPAHPGGFQLGPLSPSPSMSLPPSPPSPIYACNLNLAFVQQR